METNENLNTNMEAENATPELEAYIRRALNRQKLGSVDVDAAWQSFRAAQPSVRRRGGMVAVLRPLLWAAVGAAAMFLFMFLYYGRSLDGGNAGGKNIPVATAKSARQGGGAATVKRQPAATAANKGSQAAEALPPVIVAKAGQSAYGTQKVSTPAGMDLRMTLSDGSEVWLNAGSTVEFPQSFMGSERRVKLQGEAYFKVARNPKRPFTVVSDQMSVRVLGTEFNFKSYAGSPAAVTLVNGKVEILSQSTAEPVATLTPGEEAWYDKNGEIRIADADVYAVTQWVKGYFYFHDTPLADVLRELGRWYGLGVVFHNRKALDCKVHFSALRNASVDEALSNLNKLQSVTLRIEDGNIAVY